MVDTPAVLHASKPVIRPGTPVRNFAGIVRLDKEECDIWDAKEMYGRYTRKDGDSLATGNPAAWLFCNKHQGQFPVAFGVRY